MNTTVRPPRVAGWPRQAHPQDALLDAAGATCAAELLQLAAGTPGEVLARLRSSETGLSEIDVVVRLTDHGLNQLPTSRPPTWRARLATSVRRPFVLLLVGLDAVVAATGDPLGAALITTMVVASLGLRLYQEHRFDHLLAALKDLAAPRVTVLRRPGRGTRGRPAARDRNPRLLVPGDLILLEAGDVVPADCRIITADGLAVDQAMFTGESMPVGKHATRPDPAESEWLDRPGSGDRSARTGDLLGEPTLCLTGTIVTAGTATAVVAKTGAGTILAATTRNIASPRRPTSADLGLAAVTWLLIRLLAILVPAVFVLTVLTHHDSDWAGAALFAVAVAVGLVPEMLPVITAAAHGRGLTALARQRIVVTRPTAVQDLAGIDVLCTDKTGTLTVGRAQLTHWVTPYGIPSATVLDYAMLSAIFTAGRHNRLDAAILDAGRPLDTDVAEAQYEKIAKIEFDYTRRRASVVLDPGTGPCLVVTKGAVADVLDACISITSADGTALPLTPAARAQVEQVCQQMWDHGQRVLAMAYRTIDDDPDTVAETPPDTGWETELTLVGFLAFTDPPKPGAAQAVRDLAHQGVRTIVLTGDAPATAVAWCADGGIPPGPPVTGRDVDRLDDTALAALAATTAVFGEVDPLHKARIVRALRAAGHVVGYLGDGINDTPALRAADIGLAVPDAVAVARHAADAILLGKDLTILRAGIAAARHATLNATKYLKATLSANLGNVLSVLAASAFLPFLPMLPLQLLVQNLGYDAAQLALPLDHADPEQLTSPHRWSARDLTVFVACLAPVSSAFDLVTFWLLQHLPGMAGPAHQVLFHTGWFIESLLTQILAVLIIRTGRVPLPRSRPATIVTLAALGACTAALVLPATTAGAWLGLHPLPPLLLGVLALTVIAYLAALQTTKLVYQRITGRWL
jgi:Mg2+-importing ATPase